MSTSAATTAVLRQAGGAELVAHVRDLVVVSEAWLGSLAGAYVIGSIATGDVHSGVSDLDLLLVVDDGTDESTRRLAGERIADVAEVGPMRGAEVVVYTRDVLAAPASSLRYELNVNAGRAMERLVDTGGQPWFWFLLDVSAAREQGLAVMGPPIGQVVGVVPDSVVIDAVRASLHWHQQADPTSPDAVLNACRAWHWLERRAWLSKTAAGEWALREHDAPQIVPAALAARGAGSDDALDATAVAGFLSAVAHRVPPPP